MKNVKNFLKGSAFGTIALLSIYLSVIDAESADRGIIPTSSFFSPMDVRMSKVQPELAVIPLEKPVPTIVFVNSLEIKKPSVLDVKNRPEVSAIIEPTAQPTAVQTSAPSPTEKPVLLAAASVGIPYDEYFTMYANLYTVDKNVLVTIARCESGFRAEAVNGPYLGMYQYLASTWSSTRNAMGENPDPALRANPEESIKTSAWKIAHGGIGAWPVCGTR